MKVAVYSNSTEWNRYMKSYFRLCKEVVQPLEVDFLNSKQIVQRKIEAKPYDLVLVYEPAGKIATRGIFLNYFEELCEKMLKSHTRYSWQFGNQRVVLKENEIYYISSFRKAVSVYTAGGRYRISTSMKKEEERFLGKEFVRIHRSCLVNLEHVKEVEGIRIKLDNGKIVKASTRRKKQVTEAFLNHQQYAAKRLLNKANS
ncbi:MAG: LytTR family transcriptional regulator [Lachnospiraceae bacterium]|jgi:DNA-binding LytR/AlgR family response regulator|nr:LytTR family transcriptional regulator [Lachnospiraceae bacterium]